jgi:DNA invertase Pin-like site-specific DNA recombinase
MVYSYAYSRQAPSFPPLVSQQHEVRLLALEKSIQIDKEVVEYSSKNLILEERLEFEKFLRSMVEGNIVIVSSLSILSDRAEELIKVINCVLTHKVDLWIASSGLCINSTTSMIEIFPLLNRLREEKQEEEKQIGRPKGSKSTSKFDVYHGQIVNLLSEGISVSAISRELKVSRSSLKDYIESRKLKELAESIHRYLEEDHGEMGSDNIVLICPFEEAYNNRIKK